MLGVFYSLAGEKNSLEIFLATWETPFSNPSAPPLSSFFSYPTYISYQNDERDFYEAKFASFIQAGRLIYL